MPKQFLSINEAAERLGVSPKTLRRWEAQGIVSPKRTVGNQRRYSIADLQKADKQSLSINEAAERLGLSAKTLRRWEAKGVITPQRTSGNQRRYAVSEIEVLKDKSPKEILTPKIKKQASRDILSLEKDRFFDLASVKRPVAVEKDPVVPQINPVVYSPVPDQARKSRFNPNFSRKSAQWGVAFLSLCGALLFIGSLGLPSSTKLIALLPYINQLKDAKVSSGEEVLQSATKKRDFAFKISVPVEMLSTASVSGNLTAPNILYSVVAGDNITISGDPQNPTISTDIALNGGDGITVVGDTITNADPGSAQNIFGSIKVGSTTLTAGSNTDSFELAAGSNISLSTDSSTKKITITAADQSSSGIDGIEILEGGTTIAETATTIDFLAGDFDVGESPSGEANIQLAATLTSVSGVAGSFAVGTSLTVGGDSISEFAGTDTGLEVTGGTLSLITSCADNEVLKYTALGGWECAPDAGSGGSVGGIGAQNQVAYWTNATTLAGDNDFYWDTTNEKFGIGTNGSPVGKLSVNGTAPGKALVTLNETGDQNILTASASGITQLNLSRTGNLAIEGNISDLSQAVLTIDDDLKITGDDLIDSGDTTRITLGATTTISSSTFTLSGTTTLDATSLTAFNGGATAINFSEFDVAAGTGAITIDDDTNAGHLTIESTRLDIDSLEFTGSGSITSGGTSDLTLTAAGGNVLFSSGTTLNVGGAAGANYNFFADLTTGADTGILGSDNDLYIEDDLEVDGQVRFGNLTYSWPTSEGVSRLLQTDGSGNLTWVDPGVIPTSDDWDAINGIITPKLSTQDLLLGSQSTASARFAVINVNSGTPTASLSAGLAGGSYLTAAGILQTTAYQNLTLGGDSTGDISIAPKAGTGILNLNVGALSINGQTGATSASLNCVSVEDGIVTGFGGCGAGAGGSKWTVADGTGVLYPQNPTLDLLIGGTSTASAKFAVLNVAGTTPSASLSGSTGSTFLTSSGSLETTNRQTLTLGGGNSGDVNLSIGGSNALRINGTPGVTVENAACVTTINGIVTGTDTCPSAAATFIWQTGSGSIFQGNTTQDLLIGGIATNSAEFAITGINTGTPTATISATTNGNGISLTGSSSTIQSLQNSSLILGGDTTGNIILSDLTIASAGLTVPNGQATTLSSFTTDGGLLYTNGSGVIAQTTAGSGGECLISGGGGAPAWGSCVGSGGTNWNITNGTIQPKLAATLDFLLGGISSSSAKFAVLNINPGSGTPTASVSAGGTGGGVYLSATGTLATTAKQGLTLGDSNTGDITVGTDNTTRNITIGNTTGTSTLTLDTGTGGINIGDNANMKTIDIGGVTNSGTDTIRIATEGTIADTITIGNANASTTFALTGGDDWSISALGTLTLDGSTLDVDSLDFTGAGAITTGGTTDLTLNASGDDIVSPDRLTLGSLTGTTLATLDVRSLSGTLSVATISGQTSFASLVIENSGLGDIFTASASGRSRLSLTNAGELRFYDADASNYTGFKTASNITSNAVYELPAAFPVANNYVLQSNTSGVLTWVDPGNLPTSNFWDQTNGAIYPRNAEIYDLLLGATSTSSAEFAVIGISTGTPTATISATTNGNGLSLNASSGTIQSLQRGTLTIGGNTTGNIVLDAGSGLITLSDPTSFSSTLTLGGDTISDFVGTSLTLNSGTLETTLGTSVDLASAEITGILALANGGTGQNITGTSITDGQLLIGNNGSDGFSLATLTAGTGISITNGSGAITISQTGSGSSKWTQSDALGILYPNVSTLDFLVGGTTSSSAKFAVLNVAGTTPTASLSAGIAGGSFLSASGNLQTTAKQTLTFGGGDTGNIAIGTTGFTTCTALETIGGVLTCGSDSEGSGDGSSNWTLDTTLGVIRPNNSTVDLLIGGTSSSSARFHVFGSANLAGTTPVASISGNTSNAGLIVDNRIGDLFTASSSGQTRFTIAQNGNVGIGTTIPTSQLQIANAASGTTNTLSMYVSTTGSSRIDSTNTGSLLLNFNTGNTVAIGGATGVGGLDTTTNIYGETTFRRNADSATALRVFGSVSGGTQTLLNISSMLTGPTASVGGITTGAGLIVDNRGSGDLFSASSSGLERFTIRQNGSIQLASSMYPTCTALETVNGLLTCGTDSEGSGDGSSNWTLNSSLGVLSPNNNTLDILIGGVATSSARFAVLNVAGGTPTASLSAGLAGGSFLTAAGQLQTTNFQNLILGGGDTGNISLTPKSGGTLGITTTSLSINGQTGATSASLNCVSVEDGIVTGVGGCGAGAGGSKWTVADGTGVLYPQNPTLDLLIGGDSSSSARFHVFGSANLAGTTPVASISGNTSGAGLIVDNRIGDLFAASSSGLARFTIKQNGNVGIGTTTPTAPLHVYKNSTSDPVAQFGANDIAFAQGINVENSFGIISMFVSGGTNNFLTGSTTGDSGLRVSAGDRFLIGHTGTEFILDANGKVGIGTGTGNPNATLDVRAATNSFSIASISGATNLGFAGLVVDNSGAGNIFTASSSGLERFTIRQNGSIQLASSMYPTCTALETVNGLLTCGTDDSSAGGSSNWTLDTTLGVIRPNNSTVDLLIGGTSSSSARFHVFGSANLAGTTPVASISGNTSNAGLIVDNRIGDLFTASSSGGTQFVITQAGNVGIGTSTSNNGLTISKYDLGLRVQTSLDGGTLASFGGNGDFGIDAPSIVGGRFIVKDNGLIGINAPTPLASLDVRANFRNNALAGTTPIASVSSATSFAAMVVDNSGAGDLFTASSSGLTRFVIKQDSTIQAYGFGYQSSGFGSHSRVQLTRANGTQNAPTVVALDDVAGQFSSTAYDGTSYVSVADILMTVDGTPGTGDMPGRLTFRTVKDGQGGLTERMRITNAGYVGIGTTTPTALFDVRGDLTNTTNSGIIPMASISGKTSFASLVVDNTGSGDIFTASRSGQTKFTIGLDRIQIGTGSATGAGGAEKPQLLALDSKGSTGDPTGGRQGDMYYNTVDEKFRCYQGTGWQDCIGGGAGVAQQVVTFTGNGTFSKGNYPGLTAVRVKVQAAGAAGGGSDTNSGGESSMGSGGGGGGYAEAWVTISALSASETVTVGAGGTGVSGTTGNDGNNSSFGSHAAANGGSGGTTRASSAVAFGIGGGSGGCGTAGDALHCGGGGGSAWGEASLGISGPGGSSTMGGGAIGDRTQTQPSQNAGNAGRDYGGGGSGGITAGTGTATAGGDGGDGIIIVELYFSTSDEEIETGNHWELVNGALAPKITTNDLLIGGTSSSSARFHVFGSAALAGTTPVASVSGNTIQAGLIVDNRIGDLFTASSSGLSRFTIKNNGTIQLASAPYGTCAALTTVNGLLTCSSSSAAGWDILSGALVPQNTTYDLLVGGTSSSSARFHVWGSALAGTTPVASISGNTIQAGLIIDNRIGDLFAASSSGLNRFVIKNNGNVGIGTVLPTAMLDVNGTASISSALTFRTGAGSIQTTANNTLTLGGNTTGEISIDGIVTTPSNDLILDPTDELYLADTKNLVIGGHPGNINYNVISDSSNTNHGLDSDDDLFIEGSLEVDGTLFVDGSIDTALTQGFVVFPDSNGLLTQDTSNFFYDDTNNRLGLGVASNLTATLDVRATSGTLPAASVSGQTSNASLIVDNTGIGDLFTASKSGATKFKISNAGNVSIPGGGLFVSGGTLPSSISRVTATVGSPQSALQVGLSGNSSAANSGPSLLFFADDSTATSEFLGRVSGVWENGTNGAERSALAFTVRGNSADTNAETEVLRLSASATTPIATFSGNTNFAGLVVDNRGSGDLFAASSSGMNRFVIKQNGRVGVGTANPTAAFVVDGPENATNGIQVKNSVGGSSSLSLYMNIVSQNPAIDSNGGGLLVNFGNGQSALFGGSGAFGGADMTLGHYGTAEFRRNTESATALRIFDAPGNALFTVGTTGTTPTATIAANTSFASMVVDNKGIGDLFTASSSGLNRFVITQSGNVGIGTTLPSASLHIVQPTTQSALRIDSANSGLVNAFLINDHSGSTAIAYSSPFKTTSFFGGSGSLGTPAVGIQSNSATGIGLSLRVGHLSGNSLFSTAATASISAKTSFATLVIDNDGAGDIIAASSSGLNRFVVKQNGSVGIGTSTPTMPLDVRSAQTTTARFTNTAASSVTAGAGMIGYSDDGAALASGDRLGFFLLGGSRDTSSTLSNSVGMLGFASEAWSGTSTPGDLTFETTPTGSVTRSEVLRLTSTANFGFNTTSPLATLDVRGSIKNGGTISIASVSGRTSFAGLVVDNTGAGDIFTASRSGQTKFTIGLDRVQIGTGSALGAGGAETPQLLGLDSKGSTGDPTNGRQGDMYYNTVDEKFRCFQGTGWRDCIAISQSEYLRAEKQGPQEGAEVNSNTDHITYNVATGSGQAIFLDTTTAYVEGGSSTSRGRFTLAPGRTYKLSANIPYADFNDATGFVDYAWYDVTNGKLLGSTGSRLNVQYAGSVEHSRTGDAEAIITTTATTIVEARLITATQIDQLGANSIQLYMSAFIQVLSGAQEVSASEYLHAEERVNQSGTFVNDTLDFTDVLAYSGNSITMDDSGGSSQGRFTLKAGKTYKLMANIPFLTFDASTTTFSVRWWNVTANSLIGNVGWAHPVDRSGFSYNLVPEAHATFTPSVDTVVEVRINSSAGTTIENAANSSYAMAFIEVLSDGTKVAQFTGATSAADGAIGYVPAPLAGQEGSLLLGNGSWTAATNVKIGTTLTQPIASLSGSTTFAGMVVNNNGLGDIFAASSSGLTRFTILRNGNVTIGDTPISDIKFYVNVEAAGERIARFRDDARTADVTFLATASNTPLIRSGGGDSLSLAANDSSTASFTIASNGKLGVNTTSPLSSFDFRPNTTDGGTVAIASVSGRTTFASLMVDNTLGDLFTASSSGRNRFVIKQNGNVGIGIATPSAKLEISASDDVGLRIGTSASDQWAGIYFAEFNSNRLAIQKEGDNSLGFWTATGGPGVENWAQRMIINTEGHVGINESDPGTTLVVVSNDNNTTALTLDNLGSGSNNYISIENNGTQVGYWDNVELNVGSRLTIDIDANSGAEALCQSGDNTGDDQTVQSCSSTPAVDYAEFYATAPDVDYGDIVTIGTRTTYAKADDGNGHIIDGKFVAEKELVKSATPYDHKVIGIVSNNYNDFTSTGQDLIDVNDHPMPVALNGRVPVKIASNSAAIEAGDYITTSFVPGRGMKATKAGQVIGKALEAWAPDSGKDQILVFVTDFWRDPDIYLTSAGNINVFEKADAPALNTASTYGLSLPDGSEIIRTGVFSEAVIGNLRTGSLDVQNLSLGGMNLNDRLLGLESGFASTSAGFASPLATLQTQVLSLADRVASLEARLTASSSALLALQSFSGGGFTASSGAELSLDKLDVNDVLIGNTLNVIGYTTMNELSVTGSIRTGVLTIKGLTNGGASISTLNGELRLQDQGFGGIDILDGKVTIDVDGNVETIGELTAKKINIDTTDTLSASAGTGIITAGTKTTIINTSAVTSDSLIQITFTSDYSPAVRYWIKTKSAGDSFTVELNFPPAANAKFNWWIVN